LNENYWLENLNAKIRSVDLTRRLESNIKTLRAGDADLRF